MQFVHRRGLKDLAALSVIPDHFGSASSDSGVDEAFSGAEAGAVGPVFDAPVLNCLYGYALDVPVDGAAAWLEKVLRVAGTSHCLIDCWWSMRTGDNDWFLTEMCAGFLDEDAQFGGDLALGFVYEPAAFFVEAQFAVSDMGSDAEGEGGARGEFCLWGWGGSRFGASEKSYFCGSAAGEAE
jgi:hypothetical protein